MVLCPASYRSKLVAHINYCTLRTLVGAICKSKRRSLQSATQYKETEADTLSTVLLCIGGVYAVASFGEKSFKAKTLDSIMAAVLILSGVFVHCWM